MPVRCDHLIPYLENGGWELLEGEAVRAAIRDALAEVRRVEAAIEVSRGVVPLDGLEVLLDGESVGLIDFGTVGWETLLFDLGKAARACESGRR